MARNFDDEIEHKITEEERQRALENSRRKLYKYTFVKELPKNTTPKINQKALNKIIKVFIIFFIVVITFASYFLMTKSSVVDISLNSKGEFAVLLGDLNDYEVIFFNENGDRIGTAKTSYRGRVDIRTENDYLVISKSEITKADTYNYNGEQVFDVSYLSKFLTKTQNTYYQDVDKKIYFEVEKNLFNLNFGLETGYLEKNGEKIPLDINGDDYRGYKFFAVLSCVLVLVGIIITHFLTSKEKEKDF